MKKVTAVLTALVICLASVPALAGWEQTDGRYWYSTENGGYMAEAWLQENDSWYYFDAEGWMATGWKQIGGEWYYFGEDGAMVTGWLEEDGAQYYLNSDGRLATGWLEIGGSWYYFHGSGKLNEVMNPFSSPDPGTGEETFYLFQGDVSGSMEFVPGDTATEAGAAWFSVMFYTDYLMAKEARRDEGILFDVNLLNCTSYAGTDGSYLNLMAVSEETEQVFAAFYDSRTGNAYSFYEDEVAPERAEQLFSALCPDGYTKNTTEGLYSVYQYILEKSDSQ